jgi:hypothetical protein
MYSNINKVSEAELSDELLSKITESGSNNELLRDLTSRTVVIPASYWRTSGSTIGSNLYNLGEITDPEEEKTIIVCPTELTDSVANTKNKEAIAHANFKVISIYNSADKKYKIGLLTESLLPNIDISVDILQIPLKDGN